MNIDQREIQRKLRVLEHADRRGDVSKTCRYFGIGRARFCHQRKAYADKAEPGLLVADFERHSHPNKMSPEAKEEIFHLRRTSHLGPIRIVGYLERQSAIKVSDAGVYRTLKRHGLNRLPRGTDLRKAHTRRDNKQVPVPYVQMDVRCLIFRGKQGQQVRRDQYTAIDDAARVRALKVYKRRTQASAIDFVDCIAGTFRFRIQQIRADNGHAFQARFHWHVEDKATRHVYIKPSRPQLNGKVERSHRSDQQELDQLMSYKDDVDLAEKLDEWERLCTFARPHGAFNGKTPDEALRERQ